jgi:hypothetical protein
LKVACVPLILSTNFSTLSTIYELNNSTIVLGRYILYFPRLNSIFLLLINVFPSSLFITCLLLLIFLWHYLYNYHFLFSLLLVLPSCIFFYTALYIQNPSIS